MIERDMPPKLARIEVKEMRGSGGPYQLVMEHSYSLSSALLLEVSAAARQIWTDQYPQYRFQKTRCDQLAAAMVLRECWLQKSHGETARLFYQLGWKPLDVMLAWLIGDYTTFGESIDPACAAEAAREDPETAVWLLDPDHYRAWIDLTSNNKETYFFICWRTSWSFSNNKACSVFSNRPAWGLNVP